MAGYATRRKAKVPRTSAGRKRRNPNSRVKPKNIVTMTDVIREAERRGTIDLAVLTAAKRKALKKSSFAVPKGKGSNPGKDSYPVNDLNHAKNALSRVSANGTPQEKRLVLAAVKRKFPKLGKNSSMNKKVA